MQPLNPFLSAFSKSPILAQCLPPQQHILLVPTADVLLNSRDTETGAPLVASIASEEFLGSHVLRIPVPKAQAAGPKDAAQNLREMRGKPKVYSTVNGRSLVIKDNCIYTNKGFKSLAQANMLHDTIWYPDTLDPRPLLIYYISRPLVGSWEEVKITPAVLPPSEGSYRQLKVTPEIQSPSGSPKKKDIRSFHELLNHFPSIAKQMQAGLEKLFREFTLVFERPLPPPPSAKDIPDPEPDGPIAAAVRRAKSNSDASSDAVKGPNGSLGDAAADEDLMRTSLETAVTAAIDLFQSVDRQQLSLLGATTDLTGSVVERLIERYIAENVHHLLFPRLAALRRQDDLELEAKIRQMDHIDISQLGVAIEGGNRAKRDVVNRLGRAVEEFRKMPNASCPQEMMEILLSTTKAATQLRDAPQPGEPPGPSSEKPVMTINADTLVSLLLYVVIKAQLKHLQARLTYIRHFIFIDDVDSGEMGYALSTFEAVLSYLDRESGGLRRASKRNKALWDAVSKGDMPELRRIMEPDEEAIEDDVVVFGSSNSRRQSSSDWSFTNGTSRRSSSSFTISDRFSMGSGLSHVFPFQNGTDAMDVPILPVKRTKKVAMDTRSMSSGSEISFRSMPMSIGTLTSAIEGDTSIVRLSQTQDAFGESVPMMAIQNRQPEALKYLLSLRQYYSPDVILDDQNNEGTTLFSAAVQLGDEAIVNTILDFILDSTDDDKIRDYLAIQDTWGRSAAHYMFHAPFLIQRIGRILPWRQKDKNGQTPLFALCRSYDHPDYHTMVEEALEAATRSQGDGQPLHLDNHVDIKGNTLLHIVNDASLALQILQKCDVDVNATNEKKFTALMLASKYGRFDMVRTLFSDPRVDIAARELRGLTAVELAKDDELRNKIDDLVLFSLMPGSDSRTTGVVRSFFVEDASIRFVLKSGAPVDKQSYAVTTCRRSLTDFEHLAKLLQMESPASWIPSLADLRSPIQIPSRPSRAVLKDLQVRMDWFLRVLLAHPTFATHEMLWEFFLVPDLQLDMMAERSKLKADALLEKVHEEYEPVEDLREVEQFVDHARDMVRSVHFSTRSVARRANVVGNVGNDLYESSHILARSLSTLSFLPQSHISAFATYVRSLSPSQSSPHQTFFQAFLALYNNVEAILKALARPPQTISKIVAVRREAERSYSSLSRSSRWPLGLLDETRQRLNEEREEKARRSEGEAGRLGRELRYAQQTVAGELAGWRDMHERMGRRAIRDLARGMVIAERGRLEGLRRALRAVREVEVDVGGVGGGGGGGGSGGAGMIGDGFSPLVDATTAAVGNDGETGEGSGSSS
ncbi:VPS9 domain-containing protein [Madurella fahalii]|uniref:VPS9 domain-containing protein n=1 Tax=Madurella fahalii TaxID=1157608 RepID=A0ABQ0FZF8_9PEZI